MIYNFGFISLTDQFNKELLIQTSNILLMEGNVKGDKTRIVMVGDIEFNVLHSLEEIKNMLIPN